MAEKKEEVNVAQIADIVTLGAYDIDNYKGERKIVLQLNFSLNDLLHNAC